MEQQNEKAKLLCPHPLDIQVLHRSKRKSCARDLILLFLAIAGQTGQNVMLPMWVDSAGSTNASMSSHDFPSHDFRPFTDQYFILFISSLVFALVFGPIALVKVWLYPVQEYKYSRAPQRYLVPVGAVYGLSAVCIVFGASGERTAPYLQSILSTANIPATLLIRFIALKKIPTKRKFVCAIVTLLSLSLCLMPSIIPTIDPRQHSDQGGAKGVAGVLWPMCFMLGFVLLAVAYILIEYAVSMVSASSSKPPDVMHMIGSTNFYQFLTLALCFWVDAIPGFGSTNSIAEVWKNFKFGMQCFFGGVGCSSSCGLLGMGFMFCAILTYIGTLYLLEGEGATYVAIVQAIVTPLGFLFWTLFKEQPGFHWQPEVSITTWFNIVGLVIMVPSIYIYNTGPPDRTTASTKKLKRLSIEGSRESNASIDMSTEPP
ncbi:uncharacterized protein LOC5518936 [Nematostella vectensis]|uniref:uncharacterized protein LOC5518936 n=1 Tax=Nematostella vectensis TaxID=45351 RepID=UPI00207751A8|nr:uncharacterized protein LOC5518936 [Nematostella vectensis]